MQRPVSKPTFETWSFVTLAARTLVSLAICAIPLAPWQPTGLSSSASPRQYLSVSATDDGHLSAFYDEETSQVQVLIGLLHSFFSPARDFPLLSFFLFFLRKFSKFGY